jgi:F0F1-type ATP synthase epsilon subunit
MLMDVTVLSPQQVILQSGVRSVIAPGEQGVLEILPLHKRFLSRLISGKILIDQQAYPIKRGIIKVDQNKVVIIIEKA